MTVQMKTFQTVRQNLTTIHFGADRHWFDAQILFNIFKCIVALILQFTYMFCVADTQTDFMDSIFTTAVGVLVFMSYMHIISKMADIYFVMDKIEKIVNKSEFM